MNKYSQYNEEILLNNFFGDYVGYLVEIGAADGIANSNSRMLIEKGWKGILVEPNIYNFKKLEYLYVYGDSIILENVGCSNETKESKFYIDHNDEYHQISSFDLGWVENCKKTYGCSYEEVNMNLIKTSDLFQKHKIKKVDFLSIDTEGLDEKVIQGINFDEIEITLICLEKKSEILVDRGYEIFHETLGNTFYKKI